MLSGRYVPTFEQATHALPQDLHLNADYPFKLPAITGRTPTTITIQDREETTVRIVRKGGKEWAYVEQSSTFERAFGRKPKRFKLLPFRDDRTGTATVVQNVMADLLGKAVGNRSDRPDSRP